MLINYLLVNNLKVITYTRYVESACSNVAAKMTLNIFNHPTTLALTHTLAAVLLLPIVISALNVSSQ